MTLRLDVALFELRLFKSRSQASAALLEGRTLVNGERAKPSRELHAGDRVTLVEPRRTRTIEVLELPRASLTREAAKALVRDVGGS